jgi:hypothetical protein
MDCDCTETCRTYTTYVHCTCSLQYLIALLYWLGVQVCLQMEALHPDSFNPQLPPGYESAGTVFHRCVVCSC